MGEFLFDEFSPVSAKAWKQKIQLDLKGADYNETLLTKTNEGIVIKPFYHEEEYEKLPITDKKHASRICQSVYVDKIATTKYLGMEALQKGATALQFEAAKPFVIQELLSSDLLERSAAIHFKFSFLDEDFYSQLVALDSQTKSYLNLDLIGNLVKTGNWFFSKEKDHEILKNLVNKAPSQSFVLGVDTSAYQNAGANMVQQIAYALAHANEYLNYFDGRKTLNIQFQFAMGGNYFFEIAKLRAFRHLWKLITDAYDLEVNTKVMATPTLRNKTLYDYNVNLLRTTTECMSALLGGADTITNIAYDAIFHKSNAFGERIARNQLLILQNESYFEEAASIVNGSYYIETLTAQFAEKALTLFKSIENTGGFLKQLVEGTIQRKIEENAIKEQEQFDNGEIVLLGTNKHPNPNDVMKNDLELYPFVKIKPRKTLIRPIIPRRLAEKYEQERLDKE